MIELWPVPMCIGGVVVRACRDHQLAPMVVIFSKVFAGTMEKEGKSTFEADGNIRVCMLPCSPFRKRTYLWKVVPVGEFFEQQIGKRGRRFSNDKSRMLMTFHQRNTVPSFSKSKGGERASKAGADDSHIDINHGVITP
jgi:hypothetical protein